MPEETVVVPTEAPAPQPEVKEFRFEFQPTDEDGRPLGGKQVVVAESAEAALPKIAAMNTELVRLNRKLNRDIRIGNITQEEIPENAPRYDENKYRLSPVPLSAEERLEVVRDINDPENFDKAAQRIVKATVGDPEALRARLARLEEQQARVSAREEAEAFVRSTPEYFVCPQNFETLAGWMIKNNLDPVKENFKLAFDTLGSKGAGILVDRPVADSPAPAATVSPVAAPPAAAPSEAAPQPKRPTSSGLTREVSSDSGPSSSKNQIVYEHTIRDREGKAVDKKVFYGREALERMPGDEYKRRLIREKGFKEAVDALG